jgi:hypothetical protein
MTELELPVLNNPVDEKPVPNVPPKLNDTFDILFETRERYPVTRTVSIYTKYNIEGIVALAKSIFQKKSKIDILTITDSDGTVIYTKDEYEKAAKALSGAVEKATLEAMERRGIVPKGTVEERYGVAEPAVAELSEASEQ